MKIFKCLSRNASLVQEKEEKSLQQKCMLIFKQKKRRPAAIENKPLTPKNAKRVVSVRFAQDESAVTSSYTTDSAPNNRQLQRENAHQKYADRIGIYSIQPIHRSAKAAVGIEDTINSMDFYISPREIRSHFLDSCEETMSTEQYSIPTLSSNYTGMDSYFDDSQQHVSNSCATTESSYFHSIADDSAATDSAAADSFSQNKSSIIGARRKHCGTTTEHHTMKGRKSSKEPFIDINKRPSHRSISRGTISSRPSVFCSGNTAAPSDKCAQTCNIKHSTETRFTVAPNKGIRLPTADYGTHGSSQIVDCPKNGVKLSDTCDSLVDDCAMEVDNGAFADGESGLVDSASPVMDAHIEKDLIDVHKNKTKGSQDKPTVSAMCQRQPQTHGATRHTRIVVTVPRGKSGFGFTLTGECPPRVGRLEKDSPAQHAGIQKGDLVLRINGLNVSKSTSRIVAEHVRKTDPEYIILELQRDCSTTEAGSTDRQDGGPHQGDTTSGLLYEDVLRNHHTLETASEAGESCDDTERCYDDSMAYVYDTTSQDFTGITNSLDRPEQTVESSDGDSQTSEAMSTSLLTKHESIHRLISLELDYIDFMHYGMERFSKPLRRCILSGYQHVAIFQNVEKLVTISEYHVKQMDNSSLNAEQSGERGMFLYSPSLVYVSKIHILCEAYENYAQGLHKSNLLLHEMNKNKTFSNFVKEPTYGSIGHLSVSDFINRPVMHIHELHKTMNEIFTATSPCSPDFNNLKQIVEKLSRCARIMTEPSFAEKVPDLETKASSQNGQTARTEKDNMASPTDVGSGVPVKSVDRDVAPIQDRLVFSPRLQDLHLCLSERHLIYQGNTHISYKQGSWFKCQLLLFTDLLLMASERNNGSLYVSDSPISIQDLAGIEINRKHPSECVLHLHPTSMWRQQQTSSDTKVLLRALSPDEKFVWMTLLGQRVLSVTGDTLPHLSPA